MAECARRLGGWLLLCLAWIAAVAMDSRTAGAQAPGVAPRSPRTGAPTRPITSADIARRARAALVHIEARADDGSPLRAGSGFVVDNRATIVTNYHVVEGASTLQVRLADGSSHTNVYLVSADPEHDIVLLRVPAEGIGALPLASSEPVVGERIYVMGDPLGLEGTFSDGLVSSLRSENGQSLVQISAPISPGSSGGPVLNARGEVVGVATLTVTKGQNLNLAVPSRYVRPLLALNEAARRFASGSAPPAGDAASTGSTSAAPRASAPHFTAPASPVGPYSFRSDSIGSGERVAGFAVVMPDGIAHRLVGYWAIEPYRRNLPADSLHHWFDSPFTLQADGQVASGLWEGMEGGFWDDGDFGLVRTEAVQRQAQAWDILFFSPLSGAGDATEPMGVYAVRGQSGALGWTGVVGYVQTPLLNFEGESRWYEGLLAVDIKSAEGHVLRFTVHARRRHDGVVAIDKLNVDGGALTGNIMLAAGQARITLYHQLGTTNFHRAIALQGLKTRD